MSEFKSNRRIALLTGIASRSHSPSGVILDSMSRKGFRISLACITHVVHQPAD